MHLELKALNDNERRLLNVLRIHGMMPRHKIVEHMDVSVQAVGQIVQRLDDYQLLIHHKAIKVGLGQPPKPVSVNPEGAFSIGIKIGRRRTDILLVDLLGSVRQRLGISYALPIASEVLPKVAEHLTLLHAQCQAITWSKVIGVGVAAPFAMGGWHKTLGLSQAQSDEWLALDLQAAIQTMTTHPVLFAKDTAAACMAELLNGHGREHKNFLYLFVDTFIGGGVVSNGRWLATQHGNAGAVASAPMQSGQVLDHASLWELEQSLIAAGLDPTAAYDARALNPEHAAHTGTWLSHASKALASCIVSGTAFLDCDNVVVGGAMDSLLLERLMAQTTTALGQFNWEGLWQPRLLTGAVGSDLGALGGALMPLHDYFYA